METINFCPSNSSDFLDKLAILSKHVKENYNLTDFDIWEIESESRSIDSVKWDFAILASNHYFSNETMIEFFDRYLKLFIVNQIKNYEQSLEEFIIKNTRDKLINDLMGESLISENYEMCVKLRDLK